MILLLLLLFFIILFHYYYYYYLLSCYYYFIIFIIVIILIIIIIIVIIQVYPTLSPSFSGCWWASCFFAALRHITGFFFLPFRFLCAALLLVSFILFSIGVRLFNICMDKNHFDFLLSFTWYYMIIYMNILRQVALSAQFILDTNFWYYRYLYLFSVLFTNEYQFWLFQQRCYNIFHPNNRKYHSQLSECFVSPLPVRILLSMMNVLRQVGPCYWPNEPQLLRREPGASYNNYNNSNNPNNPITLITLS